MMQSFWELVFLHAAYKLTPTAVGEAGKVRWASFKLKGLPRWELTMVFTEVKDDAHRDGSV